MRTGEAQPNEILTTREVAALLMIGEKTAYTMTQSGELPGFEVRGPVAIPAPGPRPVDPGARGGEDRTTAKLARQLVEVTERGTSPMTTAHDHLPRG